ncbi:MAG TPA: hypothetical protein VHA10_10065 [Hypericibacter adhaerens]|nr:hypothetical protein [Hypericibacter adhaerens]
MTDFAQNRKKNLDMVICRSSPNEPPAKTGNFADLRNAYKIELVADDLACLDRLPNLPLAKPSTVLVALEAKACMTAFGKARPRLYDELNSSHLTVHGDSNQAIAAGFAMVNSAATFVSPLLNHWTIGTHPTVISQHNQPRDVQSVIEKLMQLPRRSSSGEEGFDAFAIAVVHCANDGSPVSIHTAAPAPQPGDIYNYARFVGRLAHLYATHFSGI